MDPCNELAWLLATGSDPAVRDPAEAVRLADRAVRLSGGRDPNLLDTQAAAQAAAGRFERAIETARRARELALGIHLASQAEDIRARLEDYERGIAYTQPRVDSLARAR